MHVKVLQKIVEIRAAQASSARVNVGRQRAIYAELEVERETIQIARAEEYAQWSNTITVRPLNLPIAEAWSAALSHSHAKLGVLEERLSGQAKVLAESRQALMQAQAREDVVRKLANDTSRQLRRLSDEAALHRNAELFSKRVRVQ